MSHGEFLTLSANVPALALMTKFAPMASMSAKSSFLRNKEYVCVSTKIVMMDPKKSLFWNCDAINMLIAIKIIASMTAFFLVILPAASGRFFFSGCCWSFSKSMMSLMM